MSASLVGSEMCIRDSIQGAPRNHTLSIVPAGGEAPARGTCSAGARSWAVSYTHLTLPTICSV
eukprot:8991662-Alexandrium_andersonii.AAC.1